MELTLPKRIALLGVLPERGNASTLRVLEELKMQLGFTENEIEHFSIKNITLPDGRTNITWNPELSNETKDIIIGNAAKGIITESLKALDAQNQLHVSMLPLYEMFVEEKGD